MKATLNPAAGLAPGRVRAQSLRSWLVGFCVVMAASAVQAQTPEKQNEKSSTTANQEEVVVLSPFTVTGAKDVGYDAASVLSGAGLRVPLTDVASAVSVITPRFLSDTGSTDLRDALVYQVGMEVTGPGGNFSNGNTALGFGWFAEAPQGNNTVTRVRGLAAATQARNFFRSVFPTDTYNVDRIDINRGANALLFGVGSPAGIINTSTKEASLAKTTAEVTGSVGSFGSHRESFELNQVIARQQLAVRFATLNDDKRYKQNPAFNHDKRLYGALTWRIKPLERGILSGTTIRANGEWGKVDANNPRNLTPQDRFSGWFEDTIFPEYVAAGITPKAIANASAGGFVQGNGLTVAQNINRAPVVVFPDATSATPMDAAGTVNGMPVIGRSFVSNRYLFPNGSIGTAGQDASGYYRDILNRAGVPDMNLYYAQQIIDPGLFDYNNHLIDGPNKSENMRFRATNIALEQLFFNRTLGVEIAHDREHAYEKQRILLTQTPWIAIDVNTHMWSGEVNPNFGRPMTGGQGSATDNTEDVETTRVKLFYELDLADRFAKGWGRFLGNHVFSALAQSETYTQDTRTGVPFYVSGNWIGGNSQSRFGDAGKNPTSLVYLGPNLYSVRDPRGAGIGGINADIMSQLANVASSGVFLTRLQAPTTASPALPAYAIQYLPVNIVQAEEGLYGSAFTADKSRRKLDSEAFAIQSRFFDGNLVGMIGWRKESSDTTRVSAPVDPTGEGYRLTNDPSFNLDDPSNPHQRYEHTLRSWSAVVKVPQSWLRHTPFISGLRFSYGESDNFDPPDSVSVDVFGRPIDPPMGKTTDGGIGIDMFENRVSIRWTRYKTTQTSVFNSTLTNATNAIINLHQTVYNIAKTRTDYVDANGDGWPDNYVSPPQAMLDLYNVRINNGTISSTNPGVRETSDYVARGDELEFSLRPARGLTWAFNVARQESIRSNSGTRLRELLFDTPTATGRPLMEEWRTPAAETVWTFSQGTNNVRQGFEQQVLSQYTSQVAADGGPASELREWRASSVLNYRFQTGKLKGFGLGAAVRWEDKASIGFPLTTIEIDGSPSDGIVEASDIRTYDSSRPIYGPDEWFYDGWISYQRPLFKDRVDWTIQLNVRNLFGDSDPIPALAHPNGRIAAVRIAQPRTLTLSTKFGF